MTKSVSIVIMRTESLVVKLSVTLLDGKDSNAVYSIYETDMYDYITVNLAAYVVMQYKPKLDSGIPWDASHSIRVNEMSMFTLLRGLKDFYGKYQREDLFIYYKSGMIECNPDPDDRIVISLVNNQFIELEPDVIIDPITNMILPGVVMKLNNTDNKIQLSSDEYEALLYKLDRLNIQSTALNLVTLSMLADKDDKPVFNGDIEPKPTKKQKPQLNIFQRKEKAMSVDSVIDRRVKDQTPSSLDDLPF